MKHRDLQKYLKLSKEFTKKQLIERVVFELEFAFLICNIESINEKNLINDIKECTYFSEYEYKEIINIGVSEFEKKYGIKLIRNLGCLGKCNN